MEKRQYVEIEVKVNGELRSSQFFRGVSREEIEWAVKEVEEVAYRLSKGIDGSTPEN